MNVEQLIINFVKNNLFVTKNWFNNRKEHENEKN